MIINFQSIARCLSQTMRIDLFDTNQPNKPSKQRIEPESNGKRHIPRDCSILSMPKRISLNFTMTPQKFYCGSHTHTHTFDRNSPRHTENTKPKIKRWRRRGENKKKTKLTAQILGKIYKIEQLNRLWCQGE